jgi:5'-nucleotidase
MPFSHSLSKSLLLTIVLGGSVNRFATAIDEPTAPPQHAPATPHSSGNPWPPPDTSVSWTSPQAAGRRAVRLQLLAFNDFHGNLQSPSVASARPVGGAAALAGQIRALERAAPGHTLIVHAGDQLGASPPVTSLLHNEPAIEFLNLLANRQCRYGDAMRFFDAAHWRGQPDRCNVIGTLGNHEFDAGPEEIRRLLGGGNASDGPFVENPYRGSRVPYVCANVIDRRTGRLLLPAYAVVVLGGIPVGVIGAVLRDTPSLISAWASENLTFLDEATSINRAASELSRLGIHTQVVLIHQGLEPVANGDGYGWQGPLRHIVAQLDPDIDVVVSGHTHNYTNALLPSRGTTPVLVTQAYSYGVALAQIDLRIDPVTSDVVAKSARILPVWADVAPGYPGDSDARQLTDAAQAMVAPRVARVVGQLPQPMTRAVSAAGESSLGDLVADAQRLATHADIALMNPGGLRSDLRAGPVTWGDVLTLHPFANHLVTLDMTGAQLRSLLEQQWPTDASAPPRIFKTSGLYYSWDAARPRGARVVEACDASDAPLEPQRHYRVTVNDFLANGGDGFSAFKALEPREIGPLDTEALAQFLERQEQAPELQAPVTSAPIPISPRIARADLGQAPLCAAAGSGQPQTQK